MLSVLALCVLDRPVGAQEMYLDADGDGVPTAADALQLYVPTMVDLWLYTDHDADGSEAVCDMVIEGISDGLSVNSYEVALAAEGGTVAFGDWTNAQPTMVYSFGEGASPTQFYRGFGGTTYLDAGLYYLGSVEVTVATGHPTLQFLPISGLGAWWTSFGSRCLGLDYDNTLKLGSDWFDAVGLPTSCGNGLLDDGEACDDGDLVSGDGCDEWCATEMSTDTGTDTATPDAGDTGATGDSGAPKDSGATGDTGSEPVDDDALPGDTASDGTASDPADDSGAAVPGGCGCASGIGAPSPLSVLVLWGFLLERRRRERDRRGV